MRFLALSVFTSGPTEVEELISVSLDNFGPVIPARRGGACEGTGLVGFACSNCVVMCLEVVTFEDRAVARLPSEADQRRIIFNSLKGGGDVGWY